MNGTSPRSPRPRRLRWWILAGGIVAASAAAWWAVDELPVDDAVAHETLPLIDTHGAGLQRSVERMCTWLGARKVLAGRGPADPKSVAPAAFGLPSETPVRSMWYGSR